jgi:hypothetical protein
VHFLGKKRIYKSTSVFIQPVTVSVQYNNRNTPFSKKVSKLMKLDKCTLSIVNIVCTVYVTCVLKIFPCDTWQGRTFGRSVLKK